MMKKIVGCTLTVSLLLLGQIQFANAADSKPMSVDSAMMEKSLTVLKKNLNHGFQEFDLSVDTDGKLSYKAVKRPDGGEEISEKSFQLSAIDSKSISIKSKGAMTFKCKKGAPCISFMRKETFKGRRGYDRRINLRHDRFPLTVTGDAAAKARQSFEQLVNLYSAAKK